MGLGIGLLGPIGRFTLAAFWLSALVIGSTSREADLAYCPSPNSRLHRDVLVGR